jgi:hypothetical protein
MEIGIQGDRLNFIRKAIPSPDPIQHNTPLTLSEKILHVFCFAKSRKRDGCAALRANAKNNNFTGDLSDKNYPKDQPTCDGHALPHCDRTRGAFCEGWL